MMNKIKFSNISSEDQLWDFMTSPSEDLINYLNTLTGDFLLIGGSGKMGKELAGMVIKADQINEKRRKLFIASTFSNPDELEFLENLGANCLVGDLTHPDFLESLPQVPNIIYMLGFKFGSQSNWEKAFHVNSIIPYLVARKYQHSRIVVFSSGNPYGHSPKESKGMQEDESLQPSGIYGWSIIARESSFRIAGKQYPKQSTCLYRLMYAQHLQYGVLVDLALMVQKGERISLAMPAVNLISQRDANEVAIRSFRLCKNPPQLVNVAGPVVSVRTICEKLAGHMDREARFHNDEGDMALLADDSFCRKQFGPYRDSVEEMIMATANWVQKNGGSWNKPTYFGRVNHNY